MTSKGWGADGAKDFVEVIRWVPSFVCFDGKAPDTSRGLVYSLSS